MKFQTLLLWLLLPLFVTTRSSAALKKEEDPIKLNLRTLSTFMFGVSDKNVPKQSEDMLLIGAGFGRTGTTSFLTALRRIGLKSYHMLAVMKTPGHLDMWLEHIQALKDGKPSGISDKIIDSMRANGFNATSSMPACFLYKELMERYPNARVILTVRGDGDGHAWAKSVKTSIGLMHKVTTRVPFRWFPTIKKFKVLFKFIFGLRGVYLQDNDEFDADDLATAYNGWVEEVQATVPKEKLLVFAAQDGWGPLCDFLSPLNREVNVKCQEILSSGEPYPLINEGAQQRRMIRVLSAISTVFEYGPYVLAVLAVVWFTRRSSKEKAKKE